MGKREQPRQEAIAHGARPAEQTRSREGCGSPSQDSKRKRGSLYDYRFHAAGMQIKRFPKVL
jgi:hypothetical protein